MMESRKALEMSQAEPMYDDCTLEMIEQQETEELLATLVEYCIGLEKQVVNLRCQINRLTPGDRRKPYPDPQSDLYEVFHHYAAYPRYKGVLKQLD